MVSLKVLQSSINFDIKNNYTLARQNRLFKAFLKLRGKGWYFSWGDTMRNMEKFFYFRYDDFMALADADPLVIKRLCKALKFKESLYSLLGSDLHRTGWEVWKGFGLGSFVGLPYELIEKYRWD